MKEKESYHSPSVEVIWFRSEMAIAASTDVRTSVSDPFSGNEELEW